MKHDYADNSESNNDEAGVQLAPHMEKMSLITQLKETNRSNRILHSSQILQDVPLVYHSQAQSHSHSEEVENKKEIPQKLTTQILIFRFNNKLRSKSGNVALDSVQPKFLRLLNDLGSDENMHSYKGKTIQRLISYANKTKVVSFDIYWHIMHIYNKVPILSPSSKINICLDIIILILTLIQLIMVPLKLTFNIEFDILNTAELLLYTLFTLDAIRSIITGIYIDGNLVLDRIIILKYYVFQILWMDTLTIYSYWIFSGNDLIKLFFLLRFQKVNQTLTKLELAVNLEHQNYITLIKSIFLMLFGTHLMSCLQNLIQEKTNTEWDSLFPATDGTLYSRYIHSLYWAVQTMVSVGYGDILPVTIVQKLYTNAIMFLGCCLFGYMMNSIGNILSLITENQKNYSKYQKMHDEYFSKKPIPSDLLRRIKIYSEHSYQQQQTSANMGSEILQLISEELQIEFKEQVNGRIVKNSSYFSLYSNKVQQDVVHELQEIQYLPSDLIDQRTTNLYILDTGQISLMRNKAIIEKYEGQHTRINLDAFVSGVREEGSFYSEYHSQLFMLGRESFLLMLQKHQRDFEIFSFQKDQILFYGNYNPIALSCSICKSDLHLIQKCPKLHFVFNRQKLYQKPSLQQRLFFLRTKFKTKTLKKIELNQVAALLFVEDNIHLYDRKITQEGDYKIGQTIDEPKISFRLLTPEMMPQKSNAEIKDPIQLKHQSSNESSQVVQMTSKMLIQGAQINSPLESEHVIVTSLDDFEKMFSYTYYYQEYNFDKIIYQYNRSRKKYQQQSSSVRQSLIKSSALTLRKLGSSDVANKKNFIQHRMTLKFSTPTTCGKTPLKFGQAIKLQKSAMDDTLIGMSLKNSQIIT